MGKSVRQTQDPFAYKPEYNNQVGTAIPKPAENDPFAFKPEYNNQVKKNVGAGGLETSSPTQSPSGSQLPEETATDFLTKDIEANDFVSKAVSNTDAFFPETAIKRRNQEIAQQTKIDVFSNPAKLAEYTADRIITLKDKLKSLKTQQSQLTSLGEPGEGEAFGAFSGQSIVSDKKKYNDLSQQILDTSNYIHKLKNNVANIASDFVVSQEDPKTLNPKSVGRKIVGIADPDLDEQMKVIEKAGGVLPGIRAEEMERIGLNATKNYLSKQPDIPQKKQLLDLVNSYENDFEERNYLTTAMRVREKIGAQIYKDGNQVRGAWFGLGYPNWQLKEIIDNPQTGLSDAEKKVALNYVLPLERKIIGTDIPTSGFTKSFYNAIEKSAVGTGKSLGDITGIRTEADVAGDLLSQEADQSRYRAPGEGPTPQAQLAYLNQKGRLTEPEINQKKELENYVNVRSGWSKFKDGVGDLTGQVAQMVLLTKGLGAGGKLLQAVGAEGGLLGGMTTGTVGAALSSDMVGLVVNGYLNSYDNYKQQALATMPGESKAGARDAYAKTMATVEGLSEMIFPDTKILKAFTSKLAPAVKDITSKLISQEITQQVAKEEFQSAISQYLKPFAKEFAKSELQESTEEAVVDLAQGVADSVFGGQQFDISKTGNQALNTFLTTMLYSPLVSGMAAHGAHRQNPSQNAFVKSAIVDIAANPAAYMKSVEDLQLSGEITQTQANEKVKLIKSANNFLQEIPASRLVEIKTGEGEAAQTNQQNKPMDFPEVSSYLLHRMNEGILQQQIDNSTDEVLKSKLEKDVKRSQEIRKGIFDGGIGVTPDLQDITDNPKKSDELGIADATQVLPDQLIGTPFSRGTSTTEDENKSAAESINDFGYSVKFNAPNKLEYKKGEKHADRNYVSDILSHNRDIDRAISKIDENGILKDENGEEYEVKKTSSGIDIIHKKSGEKIYSNGKRLITSGRLITDSPFMNGFEFFPSVKKSENENIQPASTESEVKAAETETSQAQNGATQTTEDQKKVIIEQAKPAIEQAVKDGIIKGGQADMVEMVLAKNDPAKIEQFLKDVADQALSKIAPEAEQGDTDSYKTAVENYSEPVVKLATKLFPAEQPVLTKDAVDLLASIGEGSQPTFITKNLERIAKENGVEVTDKMTAPDVINALKEKQKLEKKSIESKFKGYVDEPENDGSQQSGMVQDKAMREISTGFVGEVKRDNSTSYKSADEIANKTGSKVEWDKESGTLSAANDNANSVMLARNFDYKGKPLNESTKQKIKELAGKGAEFLVGDMDDVDTQFIDYLQEIGAPFTIYKTKGNKPIAGLTDSESGKISSPEGRNINIEKYNSTPKDFIDKINSSLNGFKLKFTKMLKETTSIPVDIIKDGKDVGYMSFKLADGKVSIAIVRINKNNQRKGIGEALYKSLNDALQKEGFGPLYSDKTFLSDHKSGDEIEPAAGLWKKLTNQGVAEKIGDRYRFIQKSNNKSNESKISQESATQKVGQETGKQQEGQNAGQENDEKGNVLNEPGAQPEAAAPLPSSESGAPMSGITHAQTEETRKEFGLGDSYEKTVRKDAELVAQADEEIKKGYNIEELVSKVEKGTIPTDLENTIIKKYKAGLEAQIAKDPSDENLDKLKRLVQATDKIGSETGRALRSRQGMEFRDDSLAGFFIQDINANLQAPLTDQQKETVIKEHEAIANAQAKYDAKIEALEAENAKLRAEQAIKKQKPATKKEKKTHEDYVQERKDLFEAAREKLRKLRVESQVTIVPYANELFAIAPEVGKLVKSLVAEGISGLAEITKTVYDTFKEIVPNLTDADVNNIIAGEYNEKQKTKSEIAGTLRDLRDEATLINKLDALLRGEEPKQESKKVIRNQQIEQLRQKIKDLKYEQAKAVNEEKEKQRQAAKDQKAAEKEANKKTPEQVALDSLKARTKSEIAKLEEQLKTGNFAKEETKEPLKLDKEATELKDKLIKLRQERIVRLIKQEYASRSKIRKAFDAVANVLNVPRSLMASVDFSAPLRQAAIVTVANPVTAVIAGLEMFKQAFSQKRFDRWFYDLQESPRYALMQQSGLYVADPHDPRLSAKEEQFMSNLAEKIPLVGKLVKGSERAYVSYLNKMRVDLFNRYTDALENEGFTWESHPEMYKGLASFLNNSTGRGELGPLEAAAPMLNGVFFSPRLMASRINILGLNPTYYAKLPPKIRKEALKSLAIFIGAGVSTLYLLSLSFGCKDDDKDKDCLHVETDPRSSDFGKVISGKTRWDIWGGFQQYVRIVVQLVTGQAKSVNSGKINDLDGEGLFKRTRADQLFAFFRAKLAPVPSFIIDRLAGRNVIGQKQTLIDAAVSRLTPLVAADLYTSIKEDGVKAIFTQGIPSTFGVGVQNYLPQGYDDKNIKDPVFKFLYDKNLSLHDPAQTKEMSDEQYSKFLKDRSAIIKEEWQQAIQYGIMINEKGNPTIDEDAAIKIIPADKATYEQLTGLMKSITAKATRDVHKQAAEQ